VSNSTIPSNLTTPLLEDKRVTALRKTCLSEQSQLYVQYSCDFLDEMKARNFEGLTILLVVIISCYTLNYVVYYFKISDEMNYMKWDIENTSAADFTVEILISLEMWKSYRKEEESKIG
jgi:hypothetical protein